MNIPQDILQQVADAAFKADNIWCRPHERRAVIQHALSNPALAPFLSRGIGEYTDEEIKAAAMDTFSTHGIVINSSWFRAFLAALPRREIPAPVPSDALPAVGDVLNAAGWSCGNYSQWAKLKDALPRLAGILAADAAARAEKAEANTAFNYGMLLAARERAEKAEAERDRLAERVAVLQERNVDLEDQRNAAMELANKAQAELATLKSAQLGILRPIAEMPETVPDGCMAVFRWRNDFGSWVTGICKPTNGFFAILRLPDAEATPPAEPAADATTIAKCAINNTEQHGQFRATAGYGTWGAAEPEPAAQVPLGPDDCPPGSVFRNSTMSWYRIKYAINDFVRIDVEGNNLISYEELKDLWQINTSLPDTGRWDANAWRDCSKPGKEVAK